MSMMAGRGFFRRKQMGYIVTKETIRTYKQEQIISEAANDKDALNKATDGWGKVQNAALVEEVERVYATRYDCPIVPEGVRLAT